VSLRDQLPMGRPLTTAAPTSTTTGTEEAPTPPDSLASLPAFRPPRTLPPSADNPDPAPQNLHEHQGAAAADSAKPKRETASIQGFIKKRAESYAKIAGTLLKAVGGYLNVASGETDSEAFLPDDDDLSDIPPPLGRLAARRFKLGADPEQMSDIEDIGMAAVGIGIWLVQGLSAVFEARRERRRAEKGKPVHTDSGDGQ
jgi:hypothetical protein